MTLFNSYIRLNGRLLSEEEEKIAEKLIISRQQFSFSLFQFMRCLEELSFLIIGRKEIY